MAQTRGVFALLLDFPARRLLLNRRADGKGWDLPGGGVDLSEDPLLALVREVEAETGLVASVGPHLSGPHVFKDDVADAYLATARVGELRLNDEVAEHRWVTKEEAAELPILGPQDRMGRMKTMIYAGFSVMEVPTLYGRVGEVHLNCETPDHGAYVFDEDCIVGRCGDFISVWRHLDPHGVDGYMPIAERVL